eukprot:m.85638 g.85638  ORF g.85638 m.85638 type:complete len:290 (-) comp19788_c0_seq4:3164-4033(-)
MPRSSAVREQLLPEIGSPTDAGNSPGARRGKQSLITTIRRYLDAGLAASLEARSADATRSRINATSSLDELLDLQDEPWVSPPVTAALAEVWEAVAGSGATEASPTMVAAIIDVTLPKLPFVVATEHTHGIKDALWRRFDEYNGTIEGVRSKPPFDREYAKLSRIIQKHTATMFDRDLTGDAAVRFRITIPNMLAILGDRPSGSDVPRAAFLEGFHRALMSLILTESRAMELGAIVIEASRLMVEAVNANVEGQIERARRYRPYLTCLLPCGICYFRSNFPFCLTYSCY